VTAASRAVELSASARILPGKNGKTCAIAMRR